MGISIIKSRPFWVTVIAILLLISGVFGLIVNIFYTIEFTVPVSTSPFIYIIELVFLALYIIIAFGLLSLDESARKYGIIVLIAGVIFRVFVLAIETMFGKPLLESISNLYILIYVVFAVYLNTPRVKGVFIKNPPYNS